MTRRELLIATSAGCVARAASPQTFIAGIVPAGRSDFWTNCDEVSSLGFHHIEFNNTRAQIAEAYLDRVEEFKDQMARRDVHLAGLALFSRAADRESPSDKHMVLGRFLEAVGGKYITHMLAPGDVLNEPSDVAAYSSIDLKTWAANAYEIGKRLIHEHGIKFAYHPEQGEVRLGLYKQFLDSTDDRYVFFLPDTGHIASGGADAVEVLKTYRSRLACVHLKDFKSVKAGDVPFGQGEVNLAGVIAELRRTSFSGYVMSESGGTNPSMRDYMTGTLDLRI